MVKRIIILISFVVSALIMVFQPFFLKEIMVDASPIHYIVCFYGCSAILLCWVGVSTAFRFATENDWGCFGGFFALYFGLILSPFVALHQLVFDLILPSFKKFLIIIIILALLLLVTFYPSLFKGIVGDNIGWGMRALCFLFTSTIGLFWVGAPAGWNFADNAGLGIFGRCFFAYIAIFLSLPIAIVQLFIQDDYS